MDDESLHEHQEVHKHYILNGTWDFLLWLKFWEKVATFYHPLASYVIYIALSQQASTIGNNSYTFSSYNSYTASRIIWGTKSTKLDQVIWNLECHDYTESLLLFFTLWQLLIVAFKSLLFDFWFYYFLLTCSGTSQIDTSYIVVNGRNTVLSKNVCVYQEGYSPSSSWWSYLRYWRSGWQLLLQRCGALRHRKWLLERCGPDEHTQRRSGICSIGGKAVEESQSVVTDVWYLLWTSLHYSLSSPEFRVRSGRQRWRGITVQCGAV